jgi:hypothetical protein
MREIEPYQEHPTPESHKTPYQARPPYWRRAHTDWKFWVVVFFLFAALGIYIVSYDLVLVPHN